MIHLFFPVGSSSGWDTCGKYLTIEMAKKGEVALITESQISPHNIDNEQELFCLSQTPVNTIDDKYFDRNSNMIKGISIRMLNDFDLSLWIEDIKSEKTIGYTFYYGAQLSLDHLDAAVNYDRVVAGSSFCESQLHNIGIDNTKTIIQGINPQIFNPTNSTKSLMKDRFVIFSGGKLEFRKGQDIVVKAFKIFSENHPDAILVNSWVNLWEFSLNTMAASTLIDFRFDPGDYMKSMDSLYKMNGIDTKRVITLPIKSSYQLAYIFKNTDIGIFPNRCEGGTNLMLMEYMACGKPVIATSETGHADIIRSDNAFALENYGPIKARAGDSTDYQGWVEPNIEEIVAHLETAYNNRALCRQKGEAAGKYLSELTWQKAAMEFYETAMEFV